MPINGNERIAVLDEWLATNPLPLGIETEWTGDQEEQEESQAFLGKAFGAALGLMFIILLAQFNSFYNATLVLLAVVLSTAGVLIGMLVMGQTFSIIMTGTGIVALAGIVVNNNIVLIDTYQEYERYMPRIEAIVRTAEDRIRPVLLTTITTMAGLAPMMFGLSLDFFGGGYSIEFADRALVETAGDGGGLRPWHRDGADPRVHAVDAGAAGLVRRPIVDLDRAPAGAACRSAAASRAARDWALHAPRAASGRRKSCGKTTRRAPSGPGSNPACRCARRNKTSACPQAASSSSACWRCHSSA